MAVQPFGADTTTGQMPAVVEERISGGLVVPAVAVRALDVMTPRKGTPLTDDAPTITYTNHTDHGPTPPGFALGVPFSDPRLTGKGYVRGTRSINGNVCAINVANGWLGSKDYAVGTKFGAYSPFAVEFDYYGEGICLNTIGLQASYYWRLFVDGRPVTLDPMQMDPAKVGVSHGQYAAVSWATARQRRIRIEMPNNIGPRTIWLKTANDGLSPVAKAAPTCVVLGDSWVAGTGTNNGAGLVLPKMLELLTGWETYAAGQGGTGYANPGTGSSDKFGGQARLNVVQEVQPDYLIVAGSSNDDAYTATVGAAAAALYAEVAAVSPRTRIIVVGPQNTSATVGTNRELVRAAIIAAATAAPNVALVIDPITGQWITGTGTVAANGNPGNANLYVGGDAGTDGAHLNTAGYEYWASRIAAMLPGL